MGDYPDPDEEYELMYADEMEMMRDEEIHAGEVITKKSMPAKRSLDFSSVIPKPTQVNTEFSQNKYISESEKCTTSIETKSAFNDHISNTQTSLTPNLQPLEDVIPQNNPNKRTAEELFGDIDDINFDDVELPSKRQKTDEENDLDLINKILEGRRLRQMISEPTNRLQNVLQPNYNVKENMSLDIPKWPFLPVTNSDGQRVYVRIQSEDLWDKVLDEVTDQPALHATYSKTWEEAQRILEAKQEQQAKTQEVVSNSPAKLMSEIHDATLWVEKYKPHCYIDLLSEEPVNRALLHWLHLWDKAVFKKEVKTKEPLQKNSFSKRTGQFQLMNNWKGKKEAEPEMDEDGRPHHKVALLCGPPGVGKTTLAHLLAKLAGYRPVELNASDERSTEAFRTALQSATLMRSVLDVDKRPNCLILDEIDGAPLPTVELLVKWCTATLDGAKKKGKTHALRRPVIAICNDLYATSLRPLRPVSLVVQVGGASSARVSGRVALVARAEGLSLTPNVAAALVARVQGDIRLAIHLLSFIKAGAKAELNMLDVESAAIGAKDCNKSLMQALQAIFTVNDKQPDSVFKIVQSAGEYDRLVEGVFENYLSARVDSRLMIACETLSWLRLYDTIQSWTLRNQNYSLYGALPLCIARCYGLLASRTPQRIKFPTQAQEMYRKRLELDSIVCSVWRGSGPAVSVSRSVLQLDVLPLLPYLLSPTLRSANVQLCSENERAALSACAGAMCDYGLQYVQQRTPEGLYAFVLEPDIYKIAYFGNEERARPPPAVRQAIAREQQLEFIRRNEQMTRRAITNIKTTDSKSRTSKDSNVVPNMKIDENHLPNHLQRLKPKEVIKSKPQVHKDFFGRIVPLSQVHKSDAVTDLISSSNVFYQYREGFNNAVRRNVRMRDLL